MVFVDNVLPLICRHLDGPEVPTYWQGGLDIGKYRIGPGFRASSGRRFAKQLHNH